MYIVGGLLVVIIAVWSLCSCNNKQTEDVSESIAQSELEPEAPDIDEAEETEAT